MKIKCVVVVVVVVVVASASDIGKQFRQLRFYASLIGLLLIIFILVFSSLCMFAGALALSLISFVRRRLRLPLNSVSTR